MTSLAYGSTVHFEEIYTEGISHITTQDFKYAQKLGYVVKLLATSYKKDGKVYAMTAPFMIESSHPLYNVNDVFKWHLCQWQCAWQCYVFGAGAGKLPTASAVVSDVVDCVKTQGNQCYDCME